MMHYVESHSCILILFSLFTQKEELEILVPQPGFEPGPWQWQTESYC